MNTRRINLCLQLTATALVVAAVAALAAGFLMPVDSVPVAVPVTRPAAATSRPAFASTVDSFAPLFTRSFRAPQVTTATPAVTAAVTRPDTPPPEQLVPVARLVLVGTIGESQALIRGPDGTVAVIEPGDNLEGATVLAIRPSQVDIRQNGKVITLLKPPPPSDLDMITEHRPQSE